jgi:glycerol-3-phosphate dehydrogenase (NAD(P)+)
MSAPGRIAVLGAGAWGTALASILARAGRDVVLWGRDGAMLQAIERERQNPRYLPGIKLSEKLRTSGQLADALDGAETILAVVPAQRLREVLEAVAGQAPQRPAPIVLCAKGIELSSGKLPSEITAEILPNQPVAALSGPSFATDVARGLPTAVTVAAEDETLAIRLAERLSTPHFRCYSSTDLVGVEAGGALKNVMAIAAGAAAGRQLGASAQAALVTRGFAELRRLGTAFGARPETLMGLSGLGDLILTCGSAQSRNFAYGMALGRGESVEGLPLAEGVATAGIAARIVQERNLEAPIIDAVARVLAGRLTIADAVAELLARPLKGETD